MREVAAGQERSLPGDGVDRKHSARGSQSNRGGARIQASSDELGQLRAENIAAAVGKEPCDDREWHLQVLKLSRRSSRRSRVGSALGLGHAHALVALPVEANRRRLSRGDHCAQPFRPRDRIHGETTRGGGEAARDNGPEARRRSHPGCGRALALRSRYTPCG